jgi:hypothetical protein
VILYFVTPSEQEKKRLFLLRHTLNKKPCGKINIKIFFYDVSKLHTELYSNKLKNQQKNDVILLCVCLKDK